ncbi:MAG: hypothetical protein LBD99_04840 [Candidatus Margulisbacteria bacterium]|jgi:hypothetical protein|nr:hypothetical protein [Candidatus Margulisiibacteriota bacterium]
MATNVRDSYSGNYDGVASGRSVTAAGMTALLNSCEKVAYKLTAYPYADGVGDTVYPSALAVRDLLGFDDASENVANKVKSADTDNFMSDATARSATKYPSAKLVYATILKMYRDAKGAANAAWPI